MKPSSSVPCLLAASGLLSLALLASAAPQDPASGAETAPATAGSGLTEAEKRGKHLYLTGESPSGGEVTALLATGGVEVPASTLPCGNCHGRDGRGRPEGGVDPSNVTWRALTKPYGVTHSSGREHPAYTVRDLKKAIALGTDPAGNPLHVAMPRYRMSLGDMDDLLAYMQKLGTDLDPGVSDETLVLATLLPPPGSPVASLTPAIRDVLAAYLAEINARGGLYNRSLELRSLELPADPAAAGPALERFLDAAGTFALVAPFLAGYEEPILEVARERELPVLGPFTLHPRLGFPLDRHVFYVLTGLAGQGRALAAAAVARHAEAGTAGEGGAPRAAVVHGGDPELAAAAEATAETLADAGWEEPLVLAWGGGGGQDAGEIVARLRAAGSEAVFLFTDGRRATELAAAAGAAGWHPELWTSGALGGAALFEAPAAFDGRIFLAFPTLPADRTPAGAELYGRLAEAAGLPRAALSTQLATLAAAELAVEGLKRAGREVSREKLVVELERLLDFDTGLVPPLSYGPNRRVGAGGAWVVALDLEAGGFLPIGGPGGGFVELDGAGR